VQANHVADATQISLNEIKELGAAPGPCISIFIPNDGTFPVRLRHALEKVKASVDRRLAETLEDAAHDVVPKGKALAIYCAPEFCRAFHLPETVEESVSIANHFYIKPLIPALQAERSFYVLALSQKHIRLLRCTEDNSHEVELPAEVLKVPESEDNVIQLSHFYKQVSEGITVYLRERHDESPLVIAGVEYEIATFRKVNVYPNLAHDVVHGAPDGLKGGELHKRALDAVHSFFEAPLRKALVRYEEAGTQRSSSTVKDIVKASFDGRVLDLILAEGAQYMGVFDDSTRGVKGHKQHVDGDEDLLNAAALETLLHGGEVFIVAGNQIPHGAPAVAVYRY
jgi:hypothetical protein